MREEVESFRTGRSRKPILEKYRYTLSIVGSILIVTDTLTAFFLASRRGYSFFYFIVLIVFLVGSVASIFHFVTNATP